jgi:hypothetical protein
VSHIPFPVASMAPLIVLDLDGLEVPAFERYGVVNMEDGRKWVGNAKALRRFQEFKSISARAQNRPFCVGTPPYNRGTERSPRSTGMPGGWPIPTEGTDVAEGIKQLAFAALVPDEVIAAAYRKTKSVHRAGDLLGMHGQTVATRLASMGVPRDLTFRLWTEPEKAVVRAYYEARGGSPKGEFDLKALATSLGRDHHEVCQMAGKLGLTEQGRGVSEELVEQMTVRNRKWHAENEHPRGMLGVRHTPETLAKIAESSKRLAARQTPETWAARTTKALATRTARGTAWVSTTNTYSRCRRGFRADIGFYVRSRWEANWARYLNVLMASPTDPLERWEYEPDRFWFEGIEDGVGSYQPDFELFESGREPYYHEVKGWMDAKSIVRLRRMEELYPGIGLTVVDPKMYRSVEKAMGCLIPEWEWEKPQL